MTTAERLISEFHAVTFPQQQKLETEIRELAVKAANAQGVEAVSRIYLDTWIIPALELLIAEGRTSRDLKLARDIAGI